MAQRATLCELFGARTKDFGDFCRNFDHSDVSHARARGLGCKLQEIAGILPQAVRCGWFRYAMLIATHVSEITQNRLIWTLEA
jgi:hypothetical protein